MDLLQTLFILAVIILVVWWALRRSAGESEKEAPAGHGHEGTAEHEAHGEHAGHAEEFAAEVAPEPMLVVAPEPMLVVAPVVETMPERLPEPVVPPEPVVSVEPVEILAPEPVVAAPPMVEAAFVAVPEPVIVERMIEIAPVIETQPDDLIIIEGIGPRIAGVLKNNGVITFAQLAAMEPAAIKAILTAVDERLGRIANPETWPQQAALAAKGDLEGLQKLQDSLKAGRVD